MTRSASRIQALASRCLVFGFQGLELPSEARDLIAGGAGGVILFRRNVKTARQVRELTDSIRHAAPGGPPLVSIDQEGGRVARLRGIATDLPPMRHVGRLGTAAAEEVGRLLGGELASLGFDIALAPVADVDTNPKNPVIGDRALSSDPSRAAKLAVALARGIEASGLAACGKHFPGHGDTEVDSHLDLPRVAHHPPRLRSVELVPFEALARAGVATMMTAHIVVDAVDPSRPATMSEKVLGILRRDLGYQGVVMSDDMEMGAIADRYEIGDAVVQAVAAGCDQVLVCHDLERQNRAIEALCAAVMDGTLKLERLEQAAGRVEQLAKRFSPTRPRPRPEDALRNEESLVFAKGLFDRSGKEPGEMADPTGGR